MAFAIKHENDNGAVTAATGNPIPLDSNYFEGLTTVADPITPKDNAWGNDKLAQVATETVKGRVTAGTGELEDLTKTQLTTLINAFTSVLSGAVPASGGGSTNFLRADGTWAVPAGGGATYAWYAITTDGDNIQIKATTDPNSWWTRNAPGDYLIEVADGHELSAIRFISKAAAGADQNIPSGAITIAIDYSAVTGLTWGDRSDLGNTPTLRGMDTSGDCIAAGSVTASSITLTVASVSSDVVTINAGAINSAFSDGSDVFIENLDFQ